MTDPFAGHSGSVIDFDQTVHGPDGDHVAPAAGVGAA